MTTGDKALLATCALLVFTVAFLSVLLYQSESDLRDARGLTSILRERESRWSRARDATEARIRTLTASVTAAREETEALRARVPEVVEKIKIRKIYVRERAQAELSRSPSQKGAQESLQRLDVFRDRMKTVGAGP